MYSLFMKSISNAIADVEQFHLLFLDQLGRKLDKRHYALKGGCNLRFYLKSIRYSEDMDIDVQLTSVDKLQDCVDQIIKGASFARILQSRGMTITYCSSPKQTATTQRWKLAITSTSSALPLHTKIEFSRRGMSAPVVFEPVDGLIMRDYQLTPILASHYPADVAFRQKVNALIHRTQTQARDIFDLDHLLRCGVSTRGMVLPRPFLMATTGHCCLSCIAVRIVVVSSAYGHRATLSVFRRRLRLSGQASCANQQPIDG